MLKIIQGDLLDSTEQYIAHQCNCISKSSLGLAKALFRKYPYANSYLSRTEKSKLGSIDVFGNGSDKRYIINMYSQFEPGPSKYSYGPDSNISRQEAFLDCLDKIAELNINSIAFPNFIGCGLAGGDWKWYESTLNNFASNLPNINVVLYNKG